MRCLLLLIAVLSPSPVFAQAGYGDSIGSFGSGNGQFAFPVGVNIVEGSHLLVADSGNNRIQRFNLNGQYVSQFGSYGSGNGQFNNPRGIYSVSNDYIYVADTSNARISFFDQGAFAFHDYGGANPYQSPVALGGVGVPRVADFTANRLRTFTISQNFSTPSPTGVTVSNNEIYVSGDGVVRVYNEFPSATLQRTIGNTGTGAALLTSAEAVAVSETGRVYVADRLSERIAVYTFAGSYLWQFRSSASAFNPAGIAVTNTGLVFVSDFSNHQIARFLATAEWTVNASHTFANLTLSDSLTLNAGKSLTIPGTMTMNAGSTLTVEGGSLTAGTIVVNGAAAHTGGSFAGTLSVGTLRVNGTFGSGVLVGGTQSIDTLDVGSTGVVTHGFGLAPNRLTGTGRVDVPVVQLFGNPAPFRVGAGNGTSTFAGTITGAGPFEKVGTGMLTLSGTSPLNGKTTVTAGTLDVTGSLTGSPVMVANGATLTGRGGTLQRLVTVQGGGTLAAAVDGTSGGEIFLTGGATIEGGGRLHARLAPDGAADRLKLGTGTGRLTFADAPGNRPVVALAGEVNTSQASTYILADLSPEGVYVGSVAQSNGAILGTYLNGTTTGPVRLDVSQFATMPNNLLGELIVNGNQLMARFTPVPEPGLVLMAAACGLVLARRTLRARASASSA